MIFAEVASRVGLLGKVNLPREPSERARSTGRREREKERRERRIVCEKETAGRGRERRERR